VYFCARQLDGFLIRSGKTIGDGVRFQLLLESNIVIVVVGLDPTIQEISDSLTSYFTK
jgi:hypothetical protein